MKTEDLIQELAQQGGPVRPLVNPLTKLAEWVVLSVTAVALGVALLGVRPDLASTWRTNLLPLQIGFAVALTVSAAASAMALGVPDRWRRRLVFVPLICLAAWTLVIVYAFATGGHHSAGSGVKCIRNIVVLSALPGIVLYSTLRAAAPLKVSLVGFFATLSVSGLSCAATLFICRQNNPVHFLVWHYLPVLLLSIAGAFVARRGWRDKI